MSTFNIARAVRARVPEGARVHLVDDVPLPPREFPLFAGGSQDMFFLPRVDLSLVWRCHHYLHTEPTLHAGPVQAARHTREVTEELL